MSSLDMLKGIKEADIDISDDQMERINQQIDRETNKIKEEKLPAIIVDLDSTLFNCDHRIPYILGKDRDWDSFYNEIPNDTLNRWCYEMIMRFQPTHKILLVTGRSDESKKLFYTLQQLEDHEVPYTDIFLRKEGDRRQGAEVKMEIYNDFIKEYYDVLFVLDDDPEICKMYFDLGIPSLRVLTKYRDSDYQDVEY